MTELWLDRKHGNNLYTDLQSDKTFASDNIFTGMQAFLRYFISIAVKTLRIYSFSKLEYFRLKGQR